MKKKIYNIFGVTLALVLVFIVVGAFIVPLNQAEVHAYTPSQWNVMPTPVPGPPWKLLPGSDIPDIAVANDGQTIWAVDRAAIAAPVLRSTTNGMQWSTIPTLAAAVNYVGAPKLVAVAPDDPTVVAVVATSAGVDGLPGTADDCDGIFYSNTDGATWSFMGFTPGGPTEIITDIAIGPARTGPVLGRDIVICTSNILAATFGDIYLVPGPIWTPAATPAGLVVFDFTSLALAPNWVGDRVVVVIGSDNGTFFPDFNDASLGVAPGDTYLIMLNVAPLDLVPPAPPVIVAPSPVLIETAATDSPPEMVGVPPANSIVTSSVALPSDWDSTIPMGRRSFVGWTSTNPVWWADDVYRVDNASVRKLQIAAQVSIHSVSYSGTITGSTLFAGERVGSTAVAPAMVWYTEDPQSDTPTWTYSFKPPTGALGAGADAAVGTADDPNVVVAVAPDFDTSGIVYAATNDGGTGADSAFSRSTNGGVSFNQVGLIDEVIAALRDVMPTPGHSMVFLATDDGAGNVSLWRSSTPPSLDKWERVRLVPAGGANPFATAASIIRLSPEWDTDSSLYWCDTGGTRIQRLVDGSDVFAPRTAPAPIADVAVESEDILYMASGTNVYQSSDGAWFFELPVDSGVVGTVYDLEMCPSYPELPEPGKLIAGGTAAGSVSRSPDSGTTWIPMTPFIAGGTNMQVIADEDYATNNIVYAGDLSAGSGIWRYEIGVSTVWENILPTPGLSISGLAMQGGSLYAAYHTGGVPPSGAQHTLNPTVPLSDMVWQNLNSGAEAAIFAVVPNALRVSSGSNILWAIDTLAPALMAYDDAMQPPVGGIVMPVNKFQLLAPWLGLAMVLALAIVWGSSALRRHYRH